MNWRELSRGDHGRTFVLVLETGEEVVEVLNQWCRTQAVNAARFTAIGALSAVTLGWFDWQKKRYREIPMSAQVEVLTLIGDVALDDEVPSVHAHIVVGNSDGRASGGHLLAGRVRPTLEIVLDESPTYLHKQHDPTSGLALISLPTTH